MPELHSDHRPPSQGHAPSDRGTSSTAKGLRAGPFALLYRTNSGCATAPGTTGRDARAWRRTNPGPIPEPSNFLGFTVYSARAPGAHRGAPGPFGQRPRPKTTATSARAKRTQFGPFPLDRTNSPGGGPRAKRTHFGRLIGRETNPFRPRLRRETNPLLDDRGPRTPRLGGMRHRMAQTSKIILANIPPASRSGPNPDFPSKVASAAGSSEDGHPVNDGPLRGAPGPTGIARCPPGARPRAGRAGRAVWPIGARAGRDGGRT
jgi:hypothetical protein